LDGDDDHVRPRDELSVVVMRADAVLRFDLDEAFLALVTRADLLRSHALAREHAADQGARHVAGADHSDSLRFHRHPQPNKPRSFSMKLAGWGWTFSPSSRPSSSMSCRARSLNFDGISTVTSTSWSPRPERTRCGIPLPFMRRMVPTRVAG